MLCTYKKGCARIRIRNYLYRIRIYNAADLEVEGGGAGVAADERPALAAGVAGVVVVSAARPLEVRVALRFQAAHRTKLLKVDSHEKFVLIFGGQCHSFWMFISYTGTIRRLMRSRFTYNSSIGVCLWFVG